MPDTTTEIYRQHRTAQDKYSYFLLAAVAAAIGLSLQRTATSTMEWSMIPLGFAVLAWGGSFFCGCRHLQYISSTLFANMALFQIKQGSHPSVPRDPAHIQAASKAASSAIESNSNRANKFGQAQFRLLIIGALLFIGWHITEMTIRTTQISYVTSVSTENVVKPNDEIPD